MKRAALLALLLTIITTGTVLAFTWQRGTVSLDAQAQLTNAIAAEHRRVCGGSLSVNSQLVWAARYKAQDMGYRGYFGHAYPDGSRTYHFYPRAGIPYSQAAEILAWNTYPDDLSAGVAFSAFMGSTSHRAAIRNCAYTRFGVGTFKVASGKHYYAVEFTRP